MVLVNEANRVLTDPQLRRDHDAWIAGQEQAFSADPWTTGKNERDAARPHEVNVGNDANPAPAPTELDQAYEVFKRKLPYYLLNAAALTALFLLFFAGR